MCAFAKSKNLLTVFVKIIVVWNRVTWCSFLLATFKFIKRIPTNPKIFYSYPQTSPWPLLILKNNYIHNHVKKYTYKSENTLITPFHTKKKIIVLKSIPINLKNTLIILFCTKNDFLKVIICIKIIISIIIPFHTKNNFKK